MTITSMKVNRHKKGYYPYSSTFWQSFCLLLQVALQIMMWLLELLAYIQVFLSLIVMIMWTLP